jgi:methanogenic corrinoid protein MtbC1
VDCIEAVFQAVMNGEMEAAKAAAEEGLKAGLCANQIMENGLIAAMTEVGARFER